MRGVASDGLRSLVDWQPQLDPLGAVAAAAGLLQGGFGEPGPVPRGAPLGRGPGQAAQAPLVLTRGPAHSRFGATAEELPEGGGEGATEGWAGRWLGGGGRRIARDAHLKKPGESRSDTTGGGLWELPIAS